MFDKMLPSLTKLPVSTATARWPLVETDVRLRKRIKNAYRAAHMQIVENELSFTDDDASVITSSIAWLNREGMALGAVEFDDYLLKHSRVATALLRLIDALELGKPVDRKIEAYGTVLASILVTSPSALVNYTSAYQRITTDGYVFDEQAVAAQDALVESCLLALAGQPKGQDTRRSGFHGHDASLKRAPVIPGKQWWTINPKFPKSNPVPVTVPTRCLVYTCGDRPTPFPSIGDLLYADDSLIWTHQSRFWSYPCWGKHWSPASQHQSATMCTRFVITLDAGVQLQCFPMDMSGRFEMEVHIIEAPLHLGACLDSLVIYDPNGITVQVTEVRDSITGEQYTSEIHCRLLPGLAPLPVSMDASRMEGGVRGGERMVYTHCNFNAWIGAQTICVGRFHEAHNSHWTRLASPLRVCSNPQCASRVGAWLPKALRYEDAIRKVPSA